MDTMILLMPVTAAVNGQGRCDIMSDFLYIEKKHTFIPYFKELAPKVHVTIQIESDDAKDEEIEERISRAAYNAYTGIVLERLELTAKWVRHEDGMLYCSSCGSVWSLPYHVYCGNCGKRMEEGV